jgi:hypothetical protein
MAGLQHITITARYEPRVSYGTSLSWIAPELRDAGLALIDDHLDDPMPSRTWAGSVDGRTFDRFAKSWGLPRENAVGGASKGDGGEDTAAYERTYDGMNWEVGGESPIISVSVHVGPNARRCAFRETCASAPRRGSDRTIGALRRPTGRSLSCTVVGHEARLDAGSSIRERAGGRDARVGRGTRCRSDRDVGARRAPDCVQRSRD